MPQSKQATLSQINSCSILWSRHRHILGDEMITAIHGYDRSTAEKYAAAPDGYIIVSLRRMKSVFAPAPQCFADPSRQVALHPDTVFELVEEPRRMRA